MRIISSLLWLLTLSPVICTAQETMQWRETGTTGHGGHGRRAPAALMLLGGIGATTEIVLPTLTRKPLTVADGRAVVRATGFDNYHLLLATREGTGCYDVALRYQHMGGRPSGHSPTELINAPKVPLEIVPFTLPREHWRYLGETAARFLVRFRQRPLVHQPISLETGNGTLLFAMTDAAGQVDIPLPDDFAIDGRKDAGRTPADFVVATSHDEGGIAYRTTLSGAYYRNPMHWQSSRHGLWGALMGFVVGFGMLQWATRRGTVQTGRTA